jgi:predicted nuclease of predicted toxin-antitoxin system
MKFLCDVHISFKVKSFLQSKNFYCVHVNEILQGDKTADSVIADYCNKNGLIIITKDEDFVNSYLLKKLPAKLVKVNLGNISTAMLVEVLEKALPIIMSLNERESFLLEVNKTAFFISEE